MKATRLFSILLLCSTFLFAKGEATTYQNFAVNIPEVRPGILEGYLPQKALPDSLKLVPSAPVPGSAEEHRDIDVSLKSLELRGTARWELAKKDANLHFPEAAHTFECALGLPVDEKRTPHLYLLLRRTVADASFATYSAKDHYRRVRPFMLNRVPVCTPGKEKHLRANGSYPSGHSAIGWAWALILAEIAPAHADAILTRGRAYGYSRVVCNVHWMSDVQEGRMVAAAVVAKLHANASFIRDLEAAKKEVERLRTKQVLPDAGQCAFERNALQSKTTFNALIAE